MTEQLVKYEIKTFEPTFVKDQEKIGNEVSTNWKYFMQTPATQLSKYYLGKSFDPETKLYAFYGDEMIGFLTASIVPKMNEEEKLIAYMEFPIVIQNHLEVQKLLIERGIAMLKSKGVHKINSKVSQYWGNTNNLAEVYGFNFDRDILRINRKYISSITYSNNDNIVNCDIESDEELLKNYYVTVLNTNENTFNTEFKRIKNNPNQLLAWILYKNEGNLIASVPIELPESNSDSVIIQHIQINDVENEGEIREQLLEKIYEICKENNYHKLDILGNRPNIVKISKIYSKLGFESVTVLKMFEKNI